LLNITTKSRARRTAVVYDFDSAAREQARARRIRALEAENRALARIALETKAEIDRLAARLDE
jgi:hypothetical protein